MTSRFLKTLFLVFVVSMTTPFSFGRDINASRQLLKQPAGASAASTPANGVPSIGDLVTVIDKATAGGGRSRDWSTPVKLVIIFTGLAILPSLL